MYCNFSVGNRDGSGNNNGIPRWNILTFLKIGQCVPLVNLSAEQIEVISQNCIGFGMRRNRALYLVTEISVFLVCGFCCYCSLAVLNPGECTWPLWQHSPLSPPPLDTSLDLAFPAHSPNTDCLPGLCPQFLTLYFPPSPKVIPPMFMVLTTMRILMIPNLY